MARASVWLHMKLRSVRLSQRPRQVVRHITHSPARPPVASPWRSELTFATSADVWCCHIMQKKHQRSCT